MPAFKAPESLNARKTLIWMGVLLATMFMGLSYLAVQPGAAGAGVCARDRAGRPPCGGRPRDRRCRQRAAAGP
ncbi:MAG: hypothetical protein JO020_14440 [Chloroflexi bacterium]|nr:hypothetical protein [Chloroflexota bacterium]